MKILVLTSFYSPEKGAAPHRITSMCDDLMKKGHLLSVITPLSNYPKGRFFKLHRNKIFFTEIINDIKVTRYWFFPSNSNSKLSRGLSLITSFFGAFLTSFYHLLIYPKYDLIIIQTPPLTSAYAYSLSCRLFNKKYILNVSDIWPSTAVDLGIIEKGSITWNVFSLIEKLLYKNAMSLLGQSNETIKYLRNYTHKKVHLFRNLTKADNLSKINFPKNNRVKIIYAGLLGNAQDLLGLCKKIDWSKLNIELHVFGEGVQKNQILALQNDYIFYHTPISKNEIQNEIKKYDFSLVPLRVNIFGAFPSKITATISSGVPVLFIGEGEGYEIVKRLGIGKSFKNNEISKISAFLKNYSSNRPKYVRVFAHKINVSLDSEFNYQININNLNKFLIQFNK